MLILNNNNVPKIQLNNNNVKNLKQPLLIRRRNNLLINHKYFVLFLCGLIIGIVFAKFYNFNANSEYLLLSNDLVEDNSLHQHKLVKFIVKSQAAVSTATAREPPVPTEARIQFKNKNLSLAEQLYREVRVLCWIMTNSTNHETKAKAVKKSWGPRCNKILFMSDAVDEELGSIDLNVGYGRDVLWGKTKEAFKYIYKNHINDADWFLKADDDTYVIMENLRYLLYSYQSEDPIYFGCKFKEFVKQGYMSGGAGYVLSQEAVKRFIEIGLIDANKCRPDNGGAEDVEVGFCLENVGVLAGDSRDSIGRRRFFPLGIDDHYINLIPDTTFWYSKYSFYNISQGLNCCSDLPISFHYVEPYQMNMLDHIIYDLHKPFGIVNQLEVLPTKKPFSMNMFDKNLT